MAWTSPDAYPIRNPEELKNKQATALCLVAIPVDSESTDYEVAFYDFGQDYFVLARGRSDIGDILTRDKIIGYQRFNRVKR